MRTTTRMIRALLAAVFVMAAFSVAMTTTASAKPAICRPDDGGGCLYGELIVINTGGLGPVGSIGSSIKPDPMRPAGTFTFYDRMDDGGYIFFAQGNKTPNMTIPGHSGCKVSWNPPPHVAGWIALCPAPAPWVYSRHDGRTDEDVYTVANRPTLAQPTKNSAGVPYTHCNVDYREMHCGTYEAVPVTAPSCTTPNTNHILKGVSNWWLEDVRCKVANGTGAQVVATVQYGRGTASISADGWISVTPLDKNYVGALVVEVWVKDRFGYRVGQNDPAWTAQIPVQIIPPATAVDDSYTMMSDTTLTIDAANGVSANDVFPSADLKGYNWIQQGYAPPNGTLEMDFGTGALTYTPNPGFHGTDTFRYRYDTGKSSESTTNIATVTIHVD
jgi:hypothetical protein